MKKVKVGDEVRAYFCDKLIEHIVEGECTAASDTMLRLKHYNDAHDKIVETWFHRKQCRLLGKGKLHDDLSKPQPPQRAIGWGLKNRKDPKECVLYHKESHADASLRGEPEREMWEKICLVEVGKGETVFPIRNIPLPNEAYFTKEMFFAALGNYVCAPSSEKIGWAWDWLQRKDYLR